MKKEREIKERKFKGTEIIIHHIIIRGKIPNLMVLGERVCWRIPPKRTVVHTCQKIRFKIMQIKILIWRIFTIFLSNYCTKSKSFFSSDFIMIFSSTSVFTQIFWDLSDRWSFVDSRSAKKNIKNKYWYNWNHVWYSVFFCQIFSSILLICM